MAATKKLEGSSSTSEEEELLAEDDDLHDYSEEEINSLWREKAESVDDEHFKLKKRRFYLQLIFWQKNRITWEAFDSTFGTKFPKLDMPHIRVDEIDLPGETIFCQWILDEQLEWVELADAALKSLQKTKSLHRGGIIGVYQHMPKTSEKSTAKSVKG